MFNIPMPTTFENVEKTGKIAVQIRVRILQRVANARLCGEVYYSRRFHRSEQFLQDPFVGEIDCAKIKCWTQLSDAISFELRIVIFVEIIEADDAVAARE